MSTDFVERARALTPLIRSHADEAERERRLSAPVAEALAREGLYRIALPRGCGGPEADPVTQIRTIEAVAYADGSAGWNLMIGIETFGLVVPLFARRTEILEDPMAIMCSSTAAVGRATPVDGGYRINGRWFFASGCHNSVWFGATVRTDDDEPRQCYALLPKGDYRILDTWDVGGLRGSGSHDIEVNDVFVPASRISGHLGTARVDSPLLRMPLGNRLAFNKVGVSLGIARAAIDAFVDLATAKTPFLSSQTLRQRPFAQRAVAEAELRLRSARGLVFELTDVLWRAALDGRPPELRDRALHIAACSDAARACVEAVEHVVEAAGTSANPRRSPLERMARDVRVVRQHTTVAPHHIEDAGRVLLDLPAEGTALKDYELLRPHREKK
jgi:indole-3-acetate monooxygenase